MQKYELESIIAKQRVDSIKWENLLHKDKLSFELNKLKFVSAEFEAESVRRKMELDLENAELNLKDKVDNIELEKYEAVKQLKMKQMQIDKLQKSVDEIKENLKKTTVTAPIPGLVVYKEVRNPMGIDQEKIKIGMTGIYYRNPLIELPDISELRVKVDVNENVVGSIKKGHLVVITLESGGDIYYGKVKSVAAIATKEFIDPFISRENSVNVYKVDISVITSNENGVLKPGMLASCRIITDRMQDAVYVPLQSVHEDENGSSFVFVKDNGSFKKTPVETGIDNRSFIVIKEGLISGMEVALRDPDKKLIDVGKKLESNGYGSGSLN
jgi:multidrug efflux pump subunit AcrA (membrane-fusion protein)